MRAIWSTREMPQREAVRLGYAYVAMGTNQDVDRRGPAALRVRQAGRMEAAVTREGNEAGRARRRGALRHRAGRHARRRTSCTTRPRRRAIADAGLTKDDIDGLGSSGTGLLSPIEIGEYLGLRPTWVDGTGVGGSTWEFMVEHATAAILAGHAEVVVLVYGSTTRADLKARRRGSNLSFGGRGPGAVRHAVRARADREVRDGRPPPHARVRHHDRAARRDRGVDPLQRVAQPRGVLPRPDHDRRRAELAHDRRPAHEAALLHPQRRRRRGRAHHRGARPGPARRSRCGCSAPARRPRTPR